MSSKRKLNAKSRHNERLAEDELPEEQEEEEEIPLPPSKKSKKYSKLIEDVVEEIYDVEDNSSQKETTEQQEEEGATQTENMEEDGDHELVNENKEEGEDEKEQDEEVEGETEPGEGENEDEEEDVIEHEILKKKHRPKVKALPKTKATKLVLENINRQLSASDEAPTVNLNDAHFQALNAGTNEENKGEEEKQLVPVQPEEQKQLIETKKFDEDTVIYNPGDMVKTLKTFDVLLAWYAWYQHIPISDESFEYSTFAITNVDGVVGKIFPSCRKNFTQRFLSSKGITRKFGKFIVMCPPAAVKWKELEIPL